MDLHKFDYIIAISTYLNITRAAEELHLSQPTLSAYLSGLERELNVTLFTRVNKSLKITPEGEKYVAACREILAIRDRLMHEISRDRDFEIRIGLQLGNIRMFNNVLLSFSEAHPEIRLLPNAAKSSEVYKALIDGRLDLGLVTSYSPDVHDVFPMVETECMCTFKECLYIAKNHPSLNGKDLSKKELSLEDLRVFDGYPVCLPQKQLLRDFITENVIKPNDLRPGKSIDREKADFIIADMLSEKAYSIQPKSLFPKEFAEFYLPIDSPAMQYLIYPKNTVLTSPKRMLARLLKKELAASPYYMNLT